MAATSTIKFTNSFADETKRTLEIGPFDAAKITLSDLRAKVRTLNANTAAIENLYLSDGGAKFTGVEGVTILTDSETKII